MSENKLLGQSGTSRPHHLTTDWAGRINPTRADLELRIGRIIDPGQSELSNRQRRRIEKLEEKRGKERR